MATWNGTTGYTDDQVTQLNKVTDARKTADTPDLLEAVSMWDQDSFKAKLKTFTADEIKALVNINLTVLVIQTVLQLLFMTQMQMITQAKSKHG